MTFTEPWPGLRGRQRERETLKGLVAAVKAGRGRALVLRGRPGTGKTALLEFLAAQAAGCRIGRATGGDRELTFAALQQLCGPFLDHLDRLPVPQRDALRTAFGLAAGEPPDPFLVGLAALTLLGEAARDRPLICLIEDAQWLDEASARTLRFIAGRLTTEPLGMVFATRDPLPGMPEMSVLGLTDTDAADLLEAAATGPLDPRVRDRILAEARGNPGAILELPHRLTPTELSFGGSADQDESPSPAESAPWPGSPSEAESASRPDGAAHTGSAAPTERSARGDGAARGGSSAHGESAAHAESSARGQGAAYAESSARGGSETRVDSAPRAESSGQAGGPGLDLPPQSRQFLLLAAAEPTGDVPLLWRAAGRLGIGADAAAEAEETGLVSLGERVRFRDPLLRAAVYRSASLAERRAVHQALAEATDADVDPDRLAWHRAHAAAGPDETVAEDLERAAGLALTHGGMAASASFLAAAAALTLDPVRRARRSLDAARAKAAAGEFVEALSLVAAAVSGPLDEAGQARADWVRGRIAFRSAAGEALPLLVSAALRLDPIDRTLAREACLDALSAALQAGRLAAAPPQPGRLTPATSEPGRPINGPAEAIRLTGGPPASERPADGPAQPIRLTAAPQESGRPTSGLSESGRLAGGLSAPGSGLAGGSTSGLAGGSSGGLGGGMVRAVARVVRQMPRPDRHPRRVDLLLDGLAVLGTDGYPAAAPLLHRAVRAFGGEPLTLREAFRSVGIASGVAADLWDDKQWDVLSGRHLDVVRQAGALGMLPVALGDRALFAVHSGDLAGAATFIAQSRWVAGVGSTPVASAWLAAMSGAEQRAEGLIGEALDDATAGGRGAELTMMHAAKALLCNGLGRYEEAMAAASAGAAVREGPAPVELGGPKWALAELVEAGVRSGNPNVAGRAFEQLSAMTKAAGTELALGVEAGRRALLRSGRAAEELYREAIERLAQTRIRVERARARLLFGEWLRRAGRRADARVQLRGAYEELAAMGVTAFADRARRELLATGETVRKRTVAAEGELTSQEEQIAGLAVQGLTNPEIAAALFISPRTVEWHLRKVFAKLGVGTRRELRRALPPRPTQAPA